MTIDFDDDEVEDLDDGEHHDEVGDLDDGEHHDEVGDLDDGEYVAPAPQRSSNPRSL
jgi:hypothetical protein